jgi:hypothetical protein
MSNPTPPTINPDSVTSFDETGLKLPTLPALLSQAGNLSQQIQPNVSVDSNSPVGQANANQSLTIFDSNTILAQLFSSMNPATVTGVAQDNLYAITGLVRSPATFTLQNIVVVINAPCNLPGLDSGANDINGTGFTVADNVGNRYILLGTQNGLVAGTYTFTFRAQNTGSLQSVPNTITSPLTIIEGVVSVNNPTSPLAVGQTGETDEEFRQRQQLSVAMGANGSYNGLYSKLGTLPGVNIQPRSTSPTEQPRPLIVIDNNTTNVTDSYGTPGHSIWVVIQGGSDDSIAITLAGCISTGCGFYGGTVAPVYKTVLLEDGSLLSIAFSRPIQTIIYLKLVLNKINNSSVTNSIIPSLIDKIVENSIYGLGQVVSVGNVVPVVNNAILSLAPNQLTISECKLSLDGVLWVGELIPDNIDIQFAFSTATVQITIA